MSITPSARLASLALIAFAAVGGAQVPRAYVLVTAQDSSGAPVPAAEITLTRGIKDVVAKGSTDAAGKSLISVELKDSSDFQVTMRKIGYRRADRFFEIGPYDTTRVAVVVPVPIPFGLEAVKVTAEQNLLRKSYHLDADDIQSAEMPLFDGWDVVKRLRPDMLTSRGGCATGAREVWVNGKRIRLPLYPTGITAQRARVGVPANARFSYVAVSVMSEIAPEHIQEINYHDCFDHSMAVVGNNDAIFVVLKPGVTYQENVGSFVIDAPPPPARP